MAQGYWLFKLFNSIKEEHEIDFAELELLSLLGPVERIRNFTDVLETTPLKHFKSDPPRVQDVLAYEPCYGRYQGFMETSTVVPNVERLVRRLAYTREIIGVLENIDPNSFLRSHLPERGAGKGVAIYRAGRYTMLRLLTNQYYLEKSAYVSKLSRNQKEIERNVQILLDYPFQQFYRIPASSTMAVGKRLEDYFAIREESSLYLTHMLHPYKGKFHPKMVRALLNYVMPDDNGNVMDNFAGSGTLLLEAALMGLNSIGVDINPLSALMSNVKVESLTIDPQVLESAISLFLGEVSASLAEQKTVESGRTLLIQRTVDGRESDERQVKVSKSVVDKFQSPELVGEFLVAQRVINNIVVEDNARRFLLLGLSGSISDLARRTSQTFVEVLSERLRKMSRTILLFSELNKSLKIALGNSRTLVGDARDMLACRTIDEEHGSIRNESESIDAIVNSPPYSTALDYVRNDLPQLTILNLADSLELLKQDMVGGPSLRDYSDELLLEIKKRALEFERLPMEGKRAIYRLLDEGREPDALRVYKFFKDMYLALLEMRRVLKPGGKSVIIIGNNHYKIDGEYIQVENAEVIAKIGEKIGLHRDTRLPLRVPGRADVQETDVLIGGIRRSLEKSMSGMIRYETVLVLKKPFP